MKILSWHFARLDLQLRGTAKRRWKKPSPCLDFFVFALARPLRSARVFFYLVRAIYSIHFFACSRVKPFFKNQSIILLTSLTVITSPTILFFCTAFFRSSLQGFNYFCVPCDYYYILFTGIYQDGMLHKSMPARNRCCRINSSLSLYSYSGCRGAFNMRPIGEAAVRYVLRADMESAPTIRIFQTVR